MLKNYFLNIAIMTIMTIYRRVPDWNHWYIEKSIKIWKKIFSKSLVFFKK